MTAHRVHQGSFLPPSLTPSLPSLGHLLCVSSLPGCWDIHSHEHGVHVVSGQKTHDHTNSSCAQSYQGSDQDSMKHLEACMFCCRPSQPDHSAPGLDTSYLHKRRTQLFISFLLHQKKGGHTSAVIRRQWSQVQEAHSASLHCPLTPRQCQTGP